MKKILIIYPHFPPSNLAGVHRPRLFAQHLPSFGWEPTILTVHERYYEEAPDWNLVKLLPAGLRIEKVKAFPLTKPRLIGDIGLRSLYFLYKKAKQLIQSEGFDFLYIPIPSFYCALLGRRLHRSTGIKYGIDYIDPWVHHFPGSERMFSRHWLSTKLAEWLEPIAIKKASVITGVAEGYYQDVLKRNPDLTKRALCGAMPYGGEANDHLVAHTLKEQHFLFKNSDKIQLVYAGAMLPKAYAPLKAIFAAIKSERALFSNIEFHFIGTGSRANDANSFNIKPHAVEFGLWETIVFEYPKRIPYMDVLAHLDIADGIFIMGSTEPHYTPSKTYQAVLSKKPLFAVLHSASTAVNVIRESGAGTVMSFDGAEDIENVEHHFTASFSEWLKFKSDFDFSTVDMKLFEKYSAANVTRSLAHLLNKAILSEQ